MIVETVKVGKHTRLYLVGNKSDLYKSKEWESVAPWTGDDPSISKAILKRVAVTVNPSDRKIEVPEETASEFAKLHNMEFHEVSAESGDGIENLFKSVLNAKKKK